MMIAQRNTGADTYSYKGWLNSDHFWKRAVAIWGYSIALTLAVWFIFFIIGFVAGLMGMHF